VAPVDGGPGAAGVPDRRHRYRGHAEAPLGLGIEVGPIDGIEGVIRFCDFEDPDGNQLNLYQVLE
jgi:catechol 2,3-dioxygenase-like lactoylglutathione lyase family enzyme